eukprot:s650_g4.t1
MFNSPDWCIRLHLLPAAFLAAHLVGLERCCAELRGAVLRKPEAMLRALKKTDAQVLLRALELGLSRCQGPSRCGVAETWAAAEQLLRGEGAGHARRLGKALQATPEPRGQDAETPRNQRQMKRREPRKGTDRPSAFPRRVKLMSEEVKLAEENAAQSQKLANEAMQKAKAAEQTLSSEVHRTECGALYQVVPQLVTVARSRVRSCAVQLAGHIYASHGPEVMEPILQKLRPAKQALLRSKFQEIDEDGAPDEDDAGEGEERPDLDGFLIGHAPATLSSHALAQRAPPRHGAAEDGGAFGAKGSAAAAEAVAGPQPLKQRPSFGDSGSEIARKKAGLCDFGKSGFHDPDDWMSTEYVGTRWYRAPEAAGRDLDEGL